MIQKSFYVLLLLCLSHGLLYSMHTDLFEEITFMEQQMREAARQQSEPEFQGLAIDQKYQTELHQIKQDYEENLRFIEEAIQEVDKNMQQVSAK